MPQPPLSGPIDLHTHSSVSDGTQAPGELVREAASLGLRAVALTDHDSTAGWAEASAAALDAGIMLLPGMELSTRVEWASVHILGYLLDPADPALAEETARIRAGRRDRAERIVQRIAVDYDLTWEDVLEQVDEGATVGRPHLADALVARGHVADRDEAFRRVLASGSPYHVGHYAPRAVDAVRLVLEAGGVPVMAHPLAARRGRVVSDATIAELAAAGLAGLEVDHPDHLPEERAHLRALAAELGLLSTGASDYHGTGRSQALGQQLTDPAVLAAIEDAARGATAVRG